MQRPKLLTLLAVAIPIFALCETSVTRIEIQRGEKWWGVFVNDAPAEPFLKPFSTETNQYSANGSFTAPMMVSSDGRYLWSKDPLKIDFSPTTITVSSENGAVYVQKGGKNLREAYLVCCHKNFPPSGKVPAIDLFTTPVYETRNEFGYVHNQSGVSEYAKRIIKENFPKGTIVISDGWRSLSGAYDFDREYYPDPRQMIDELHRMGFKVMLTVTPFVAASGRNYIANLNDGNLICKDNGAPLIVENDGGYNTCIDISKSSTQGMLLQRLDFLKRSYGVDGFRFDSRSLLPYLNRSGNRDKFMSGWLSLGQGTELCEFFPGADTQLSATVNCIRNNDSQGWASITEDINDMISAGMSGFPYCHITSAKQDTEVLFTDQKLMMRTLQMSAFKPIVSIDFAPWRIKSSALLQQVRDAFEFRDSIKSYIRSSLEESSRTAEPLIRSMEYQFPRNGFSDCNDQFMLGDKYLIVVIANDEPKRIVRLPRGMWTDSAGRKYKGPLVTNIDVSDGRVVYFELATK